MPDTRHLVATAKAVRDGVKRHHLTILAAGIAFYVMLAIVPTLLATVSIYGLVADSDEIEQHIEDAAEQLPEGSGDFIVDQLTDLTDTSGLGLSALIGLTLALWSASGATSNLMKGISAVHETEEERGFLVFRGLALLMTLGSIIVVGLTVVGFGLLRPILEWIGLGDGPINALLLARWPFLIVVVAVAMSLLYQLGPDLPVERWRVVVPGALVATALWLGISGLLSRFGSGIFSTYGETYGTLAGLIILLIWLMLSVLSVLIGAEIEAHRRLGDGRAEVGAEDTEASPTETEAETSDTETPHSETSSA
jgi:membrane protein